MNLYHFQFLRQSPILSSIYYFIILYNATCSWDFDSFKVLLHWNINILTTLHVWENFDHSKCCFGCLFSKYADNKIPFQRETRWNLTSQPTHYGYPEYIWQLTTMLQILDCAFVIEIVIVMQLLETWSAKTSQHSSVCYSHSCVFYLTNTSEIGLYIGWNLSRFIDSEYQISCCFSKRTSEVFIFLKLFLNFCLFLRVCCKYLCDFCIKIY